MVSVITLILAALSISAISIVGVLFNFMYRNGKYEQERGNKVQNKVPSSDIMDIIRSSWCKTVIEEFGESCCHLFDYIKRQQNNEWGTVLDAGTGSHSLDWLLNQKTDSITAITGDPKRQAAMENMFKGQLRSQDIVISGNWKDPKLLQGKVFDVVIADYLLGSLDGYAPYFQDRLFDRIKPHVGKVLYVVGAEPLPDMVEGNPHGQLIVDIAKLRDACILLTGDRPYREYPMDWVIRNLRQLGYRINSVASFETTYNQDYVETQINVAEAKLSRIKDQRVAEVMQGYIDKVRSKVHKLKWGIKFSSDYVIAASPTTHNHSKHPQNEEHVDKVLNTYKSPIEQQNAIFPIDDE